MEANPVDAAASNEANPIQDPKGGFHSMFEGWNLTILFSALPADDRQL
jgi:hypothetical protein